MAIFAWDNSFSVGIDRVDAQHHKLVDLVNALDDAVSAGRERGEIRAILKDLLDYTQYHFGTEERLMEQAGQTGEHYRRHKKEHDDFVAMTMKLVEGVRERDENVAPPLLHYLIKWLADHILGSDREMARHLLDPDAPALSDSASVERARDVQRAERKLLDALNESEWRFRTIADNAPVLIWMSDAKGERVFFSQPWSEFTGLARDRLAREWKSRVHPDDLAGLEASYAAARSGVEAEYRLRRADGAYRWMQERAAPRAELGGVGFVGSCFDVTELKLHERTLEQQVAERTMALSEANQRLEEEKAEQAALITRLKETQAQLLQSEKMASIGQLAAGVAHEINNPVGYVKSNLNSLADYVSDLLRLLDVYANDRDSAERLKQELDYGFLREDVNKLLAESREGVERVQHIVQDLKDFSHADQAEWQHADLQRGLESTLNLVWNELKYKAEVVREYADLPPVECIARQINQVFMNILVNAAQAIPDHGTITVRARQEGPWAVVEVSDTGVGIPAEKINRIFEPFFTTKPVGKGTGLGLSIAYGIVQKHGGRIEVASELGQGTTFAVYLPLARVEGRY